MSFVFVSHAQTDKKKIRYIVDALIRAGLKIWIDRPEDVGLTAEDIYRHVIRLPAGAHWREEIDEALRSAFAVLVCWSAAAIEERRITQGEAEYARIVKKLVSCAIDDAGLSYREGQILDLRTGRDESALNSAINLMIQDLKKLMEAPILNQTGIQRVRTIDEQRPLRKVFISYRRTDASHIIKDIYDFLATRVSEENIFLDVDSIPLGVDFKNHIRASMRDSSHMLAIIGKKWANPDWTGNRRWFGASKQTEDFVQSEIELAMEHGVFIVPVLVDLKNMPAAEHLPPYIRVITSLNAAFMHSRSIERDLEALLRKIDPRYEYL